MGSRFDDALHVFVSQGWRRNEQGRTAVWSRDVDAVHHEHMAVGIEIDRTSDGVSIVMVLRAVAMSIRCRSDRQFHAASNRGRREDEGGFRRPFFDLSPPC